VKDDLQDWYYVVYYGEGECEHVKGGIAVVRVRIIRSIEVVHSSKYPDTAWRIDTLQTTFGKYRTAFQTLPVWIT